MGADRPKKIFGFKEHLDWFKIDLNAVKIITVQDYKQKANVNRSAYTQC